MPFKRYNILPDESVREDAQEFLAPIRYATRLLRASSFEVQVRNQQTTVTKSVIQFTRLTKKLIYVSTQYFNHKDY